MIKVNNDPVSGFWGKLEIFFDDSLIINGNQKISAIFSQATGSLEQIKDSSLVKIKSPELINNNQIKIKYECKDKYVEQIKIRPEGSQIPKFAEFVREILSLYSQEHKKVGAAVKDGKPAGCPIGLGSPDLNSMFCFHERVILLLNGKFIAGSFDRVEKRIFIYNRISSSSICFIFNISKEKKINQMQNEVQQVVIPQARLGEYVKVRPECLDGKFFLEHINELYPNLKKGRIDIISHCYLSKHHLCDELTEEKVKEKWKEFQKIEKMEIG